MTRGPALALTVTVLAAAAQAQEVPYAVNDPRIEPPVKLTGDAPTYPPEAKTKCLEGTVRLKAVVAVDGFVTDVEVVEDDHRMANWARQWVYDWTYEPGALKESGKPVEVAVPLTFRFEDPCILPDGVFRVGRDVSAPRKKRAMLPLYTQAARDACVEGVVILDALINLDGQVSNVKVVKSLPGGLTAAAKDAVENWLFEPAVHDGDPVPVAYTLTVNFELPGKCERPRLLDLVPISSPLPDVGDLTGELTAVLRISRTGRVVDVEVIAVSDRRLLKAARKALLDWRYEPPVNPDTGKRTAASATVSFRFPHTAK